MKLFTLTLAIVLLSASQVRAEMVLASFDFTDGSLAVTEEFFTGSTSDITLGSNVMTDATNGTLTSPASGTGTNTSTDNGFTFIYTVRGLAADQTLNLDSFSIGHTGASNTFRFNASLNGTNIGTNTNPPNSGTYTPSFTGNATATDLLNGDEVIIGFLSRDNTAGGTLTLDNFSLSGTVVSPVPEPSSLVLFGTYCVTLLRRRRKK